MLVFMKNRLFSIGVFLMAVLVCVAILNFYPQRNYNAIMNPSKAIASTTDDVAEQVLVKSADDVAGRMVASSADDIAVSAKGLDSAANATAHNAAQFEKLKASYAADEIINAERVGTALSKNDASHLSASFLSREQLAAGKVTGFRGGDGIQRTLLQTKGELNGKAGIFEYVLSPEGKVSHQRFIDGGIFTGYPNQMVPKGGY